MEDFELCYEEGGISDNPAYSAWLKMYHPEPSSPESPLSNYYQTALKHSLLDSFIDCSQQPQFHPRIKATPSVRVLTSSENLERIDQRKREKEEKDQQKEARAKAREARKRRKS